MPTATETGIDRKALHDKMREGGFRNLDEKMGRVSSGNEKRQETEKGKRRVKNQAEIDRVREQNEKIARENEIIIRENEGIEKRRVEITGAVEGAMALVARKLRSRDLSDAERARLGWVETSVKDAYNKLERGKYQVEIKEGEKVIESRPEGLLTEGLITEVGLQIKNLQQEVERVRQIRDLKEKADQDKLDEGPRKREWYKILQNLPDGNLKKRITDRMEGWKKADESNGEKYDEAKTQQQLGEACFQIIKEYSQDQIDRLKKLSGEKETEIQRLNKTFRVLADSSEKYFYHHYKKLSSELSEAEKARQHKYTEREAGLIANDPTYRGLLLDRYKKKLPGGFDRMGRQQQDYELAMLALDGRLVLDVPQAKKLLEQDKEPEPIYEEESKPVLSPEPVLKPEPVMQPKPEPVTETHPKAVENKLFLIDISEIAKRMAWTQTEERIQKEYKEMGRFKRAFKGLTENKRRIEYYQENLNRIQNDNNLMAAISERASGQKLPGGTPRISAEYLELVDKIVAEYKHDVADTQREVGDSMNKDPEVQRRFAELLYRFRSGKWDGAQYNGLDKRAAVELFVKENVAGYINKQTSAQWTKDGDRLKEAKGLLYASNFYEIMESVDQNYKGQIDKAVKEVMDKNPEANIEAVTAAISKQVEGVQGLNLQLGLRDRDIVNNRPKGILNAYEKLVNWGENHKVLGKIVMNPFVLGAGATLASQGVQRIIKWGAVGAAAAVGVTGFWVPLGIGAAVGGAYRAFKRSKDVKYDIAQELRHETLGGRGSDILDKNGGLRYEGAVMSYQDALARIATLKGKTSFNDAEKKQLAEIYARLQLERDLLKTTDKDFMKVDLFSLTEDQGKRFGSPAAAKSDLRVALKGLGITEQQLQGLIDAEKGGVLDIIRNITKQQEGFRRKEMVKAGVGGALLGLAGGVVAQQASYELGRLFGSDYFTSHGTILEKTLKLKHGLFGTAGQEKIISPGGVVGTAVTRSRTLLEWMHDMKGHVNGGDVEKIHTANWYDNPDYEDVVNPAGHTHQANELKFQISKDGADNFHFKVPVKETGVPDGSWLIKDKTLLAPDLQKAFTEDRIKMIFVPDGSNPHDGIVLDVDPATKEIVVPPGSNLRDLFDPATGRPKGTGYFGLAEQVGARPDGSKNYIWINSMRNDGKDFDFGAIKEGDPGKIAPPVFGREDVANYDNTIPVVPLTRKVWLRPEERAKEEEKKKQKEAAKQKKKAEKKATKQKKKDQGKSGHSSSDHESGGGGETAGKKTGEKKEQQAVKEPDFGNKEVQARYLKPEYAAELLKVYESRGNDLPAIDKKAVKYVIEGDKHKGVTLIDRPVKKDRAKAVWQLEQALVGAKAISQEQADEFYEEQAVIAQAAKEKEAAKPKAGEGKGAPDKEEKSAPTGTRKTDEGEKGEETGKKEVSKETSKPHETPEEIKKFKEDYPEVRVYTRKAKKQGAKFDTKDLFKRVTALMGILEKSGSYKSGQEFNIDILAKDEHPKKTGKGLVLPHDFTPAKAAELYSAEAENGKEPRRKAA